MSNVAYQIHAKYTNEYVIFENMLLFYNLKVYVSSYQPLALKCYRYSVY